MDDEATREAAVRAARAHARAANDVAQFVQQLSGAPDPAAVAEYANLLAREESTFEERTQALRAAGLSVPSLDADEG